jgi:hypothetical protein
MLFIDQVCQAYDGALSVSLAAQGYARPFGTCTEIGAIKPLGGGRPKSRSFVNPRFALRYPVEL